MLKDAINLHALKRVLVIKLRHHGDVLLSSPVFSVLKNHALHLEIDALVYLETAEMLTLHPAISTVFGIDRNWKKRSMLARLAAERELFEALSARKYDLILHLTEHPRGAWLSRLLGPQFSVGPKRGGKLWRNSFTHLYSTPANLFANYGRHAVERNLDALRRIGVYPNAHERALTLVPGREAAERVDTLLAEHGLPAKSFLHLHPASRWHFKCWPAEKTAELINRLTARGERIVLTAAPSVTEMALIEAILRDVTAPEAALVNFAGQLSLKELAALTARARLFVGVDSAPMHMASAMQTPVVTLFGPSGELEWGPWQVAHRIVKSAQHPCRPCGLDGCGGGKVSECLTTLPVAQVLDAVQGLLQESIPVTNSTP